MLILTIVLFLIVVLLFVGLLARFYRKNRFERAKQFVDNGDYENALRLLHLLTAKSNSGVFSWYTGLCQEQLGNIEHAIVEYNKAAISEEFKSSQKAAEVHGKISEMYLKLGNVGKAEEELRIVLSLDDKNARACYTLATIFKNRGSQQSALEFLDRAVEAKGAFFEAHMERGKISHALNYFEKARGSFLKALELDPDCTEAHYYYGLVLEKAKNYRKSADELLPAAKDERFAFEASAHLGSLYYKLSDTVRSFDHYERAISISTEDTVRLQEIRYDYAEALVSEGNIAKALELWSKVNAEQPGFRDTAQKLRIYSEVNESPALTRIMTASKKEVHDIGVSLCKKLGVKIMKHNYGRENFIEYIGTIRSGRSEIGALLHLGRWTSQVGEIPIRDLIERMSEEGAGRGFFVTTSDFSDKARKIAGIRPIELIDKEGLIYLMSGISGGINGGNNRRTEG